MSAWVPLTVDEFRNALPLAFLDQHDAWVGEYPTKQFRMVEIVAETVNRFRNAARSNSRNVISDDLTTVPATGFDYAFAVAAYTLGMEMGMTSTGVVSGSTTVNVIVPPGGTTVTPLATGSSGSTPAALNFMDAMSRQVIRAEVWLRLVQSGTLPILGDEPFGTPSFKRVRRRSLGCWMRDDQRVVADTGFDGGAT